MVGMEFCGTGRFFLCMILLLLFFKKKKKVIETMGLFRNIAFRKLMLFLFYESIIVMLVCDFPFSCIEE